MVAAQSKTKLYQVFSDQHRYFKWLYFLVSHFYHRFSKLSLGQISDLKVAAPRVTEVVSLQSDQYRLVGDFYAPSAQPNSSAVILLHGSSIFGRKLTLMKALAQEFRELGYAVLAIDMRGYGASDDPDVDQAKNFDFAQDVTVAIDFLQSYAPQLSQQIHVFGHSLGGAVALAAQARDARIQKTISFGPPRRLTERFLHPEAREKKKLLVRWQADMQFAQPISYAVWEQVLQPLNIETYVDQFAIAGHPPLFLIDAEQEPAADLEFLRQIYQQAAPPIEYWTVPQTDHYLGSGYLFGVPCYRQSIVQDFVRRIDRWLQG